MSLFPQGRLGDEVVYSDDTKIIWPDTESKTLARWLKKHWTRKQIRELEVMLHE